MPLSLLMQFYNKRLELLIDGPESYMRAKKSLSEIRLQERMDSDPLFRMLSDSNRLDSLSLFGKSRRFKL
jgi:hypothetical protein